MLLNILLRDNQEPYMEIYDWKTYHNHKQRNSLSDETKNEQQQEWEPETKTADIFANH